MIASLVVSVVPLGGKHLPLFALGAAFGVLTQVICQSTGNKKACVFTAGF